MYSYLKVNRWPGKFRNESAVDVALSDGTLDFVLVDDYLLHYLDDACYLQVSISKQVDSGNTLIVLPQELFYSGTHFATVPSNDLANL